MRSFPPPSRWGNRMLDSPPPSPRDHKNGLVSNSSFDKPASQRSKSVQFVSEGDGTMSPLETTLPLTPEHSFSQELSTPVVTPSPARGGTRIGRLASLFSSRAVVTATASPPRSDSSSGYVGWPGTQDKRGGTVEVEQSSDSASEITEKIHRFTSPMNGNVRGVQDIYGHERPHMALADPWADMDETHSVASTKFSKTSSAYFSSATRPSEHDRHAVAASVMRKSLTEEALRLKDHLAPPNKITSMGYRGLIEKTRDVPNLMDGTESESSSVSGIASVRKRDPEASSDVFDGVSRSGDSDVIEGVSNNSNNNRYLDRTPSIPENFTLGAIPRNDNEHLNLVLLGGGLTTIQTTANDFSNRKTASDFDENLTNSDYDQYGFARIPGFNEMASAGKKVNDQAVGAQHFILPSVRSSRRGNSRSEPGSEVTSSSIFSDQHEVDSWGESVRDGIQQYYVLPDEMKSLVKKFRKMSSKMSSRLSYEEMEREEDAMKAFALMEMRSRIMEKDIERGLERRGGTSIVDDLVLTPYNRAAMRVRDALVVAKAWRDGATPKDVFNTAMLTRRPERAYYILRHVQPDPWQRTPQYEWEQVRWHDDLELSQFHCHSIGPRHLRGFEMFTIGDCQSILLKLCNQQCVELRLQLNEATARQLEAEDDMKAEEAAGCGIDGMMTEAEMRYLTAMEVVKTVSHKLVLAEKAFTLVRDRIEKLVAKYEALLIKLDNDAESVAPSSVITDASSYYSDYTSGTLHDEKERESLARRAQRAELRAELAAREAMLTRQRAEEFQKEKEMEIQVLRQKLHDLQSDTSTAVAEREQSVVVARVIAANRRGPGSQLSSIKSTISASKIEDVKQRFRSRSAGRNAFNPPRPNAASSRAVKSPHVIRRQYPSDPSSKGRSAMLRAVGEEMFQHLDFYERSLKAVESSTS